MNRKVIVVITGGLVVVSMCALAALIAIGIPLLVQVAQGASFFEIRPALERTFPSWIPDTGEGSPMPTHEPVQEDRGDVVPGKQAGTRNPPAAASRNFDRFYPAPAT